MKRRGNDTKADMDSQTYPDTKREGTRYKSSRLFCTVLLSLTHVLFREGKIKQKYIVKAGRDLEDCTVVKVELCPSYADDVCTIKYLNTANGVVC